MLDRKLCVWTNTVGMWTSLLQCVGGQYVCGQQCHSGCVDSSVTVGCVYNSVSVSVGTDPYSGSARRSPVSQVNVVLSQVLLPLLLPSGGPGRNMAGPGPSQL